ncbi:MAG TPA: 3',5'-cyclic-nucleotide phosphodiesterase [Thermoanaerobaculia bacterium]|nr:3',5'-cyclic-nucleotide phosphodiesterase [Thermoanaerobaculia bacterium]
MQIRVLGAYGGSTPRHRQTSFLIDGTVALDAGAITASLELEEQSRVRAILVTHSHMDHVASLPFLVENVFGRVEGPIEIVAPPEVVLSLQTHLFNNDLWPDFTRIPNHLLPVVSFRAVEPGRPFPVNGLTAVAVPVSHVVPTYGYLVSDGHASVVFSGDTGPTEEIWRRAAREKDLAAIFVECSFPDAMHEIADISKHLTPKTLAKEIDKFPPKVPINVYHMKPPSADAIAAELGALACPRLRLLADGDVLDY